MVSEFEAATAWRIYKTLPPFPATGPLPLPLIHPLAPVGGQVLKIGRSDLDPTYHICTNTLQTDPTRLMHLKFWKSKSVTSSATLPIAASHPPEKVKQDGIPGEDPIPLIIVEGFCGGAGDALWGDFANHLNAGAQDGRKRKTQFVKWVMMQMHDAFDGPGSDINPRLIAESDLSARYTIAPASCFSRSRAVQVTGCLLPWHGYSS